MATLPVSNINLDSSVQYTDEPSHTWYISQDAKRIQGYCDDYTAIRQAVEIILNTVRFRWQIYDPSSGIDYTGLIGKDPAFVAVELQRRLKEALFMDTRVLGISDFQYSVYEDSMSATFTVNTVFGALSESLEVSND